MKSNNLILAHYGQLRTIETSLEVMIAVKQKKKNTMWGNIYEHEELTDEIEELTETLKDIQRATISYASTFEIDSIAST